MFVLLFINNVIGTVLCYICVIKMLDNSSKN